MKAIMIFIALLMPMQLIAAEITELPPKSWTMS